MSHKIDEQKVIELRNKGLSPSQILAKWPEIAYAGQGNTPQPQLQTIKLIIRNAKKSGLITYLSRREKMYNKKHQGTRGVLQQIRHQPDEIIKNLPPALVDEISLEMYRRAVEHPQIKAELNECRNIIACQKAEIQTLKQQVSEKSQRDLAIKAIQTGVLVTHAE